MPDPNTASTLSLKNTPTIPIGIIDITIDMAYRVASFILNSNNPRNIHHISRHKMTMVDNTVATCTTIVNDKFWSASTPSKCDAITR